MNNYLPATLPQRRILNAESLFPESDQYMLRVLYDFNKIEPPTMLLALSEILYKQEDINSRFCLRNGGTEFSHYVGEPDVSLIHLLEEGDVIWQERYGFMQRFSTLWDKPLYEFFIQAIPGDEGGGTRVWGKFHHVLLDGTGINLLGKWIAEACAVVSANGQLVKRHQVQMACLQAEAAYSHSDTWQRDAEFWGKQLQDTRLFPKKLRGGSDSCGTVVIDFEPELTQRLNAYSKSFPTPLSAFRLALAIIGAYLFRRFDCDALPILTAHAGRRNKGNVAESISMQTNTLLLNIKRVSGQNFGELAMHVNLLLSEVLHHGQYPLEEVVEKLNSQGEDTSMLWNFSVVSNACRTQPFAMEFTKKQSIPFGLVFRVNSCRDDRDGLQRIHLHFRHAAYSQQDANRMAEGIKTMVINLLDNPDRAIDRLQILGEEERDLLLSGFQVASPISSDSDATFVDLFRKCAAEHPQHIALRDRQQSLSFAEVDSLTDRLAFLLEAKGPVRGRVIALAISRDNAFPLAVYAVMKAGASYLPLDPDYPLSRLEYMLADSEAPLLIVDDNSPISGERLSELGLSVLDIHALLAEAEQLDTRFSLPRSPDLFSPAYMIYTSGSTGTPKGVVISHKALATFVIWMVELMQLNKNSRVALHSSFSFDAAVIALFPPMCAGSEMHIIDTETRLDMDALHRYLHEKAITDIFLTTQICVEFLRRFDAPGLTISTGGEKLRSVPDHAGRLFNFYGPTEFTVLATGHLVDPQRCYDNIPIGTPMPGVRHYIVDRNRELLPIGTEGELYLSGPQIADGYWNKPEITHLAFVDNPFADTLDTQRMYRTGDRATWNERGEVEYLGRNDDQIKLRGFRIELGEIETAIRNISGVNDVVIVVRGDVLDAYFQADRPINDAELRNALHQNLPGYMVPSGFMQLESLPITPNGKINYQKLPPLSVISDLKAPVNALQRRICAIISELIGNDAFGVDTNLYHAGMSSLSAIKIAAQLNHELNVTLSPLAIMRDATVAGVEVLIGQAKPTQVKTARKSRRVYPLSTTQWGIYYDCAKRPDSLIYNIPLGLKLPQKTNIDKLQRALQAVVAVHPTLKAGLIMEGTTLGLERRDEANIVVSRLECCESEIEKVMHNFVQPFDLFIGPLFRLTLCRTESHLWLLADFHHLIFDGFSADVFLRDLSLAYLGHTLAEENVSAFEVGLDEQEQNISLARSYYDGRLALIDNPTVLAPRQSAEKNHAVGNSNTVNLSVERLEIDSFCARMGLTPGSLFLGASALLISRFVSNRHLLLSIIHNGRDDARYHNSVGMLAKTLPLTLELQVEEGLQDYLLRVKEEILNTIEHQTYSFTHLVADRHWVPEINFAFQDLPANNDLLEGEGIKFETLILPELKKAPKFPLTIEINAMESVYQLNVEYSDALYERSFMNTLVDSLAHIVRTMCRMEANARVSSIGLMTEEQARRLALFNEPITPNVTSRNLHSRFEQEVACQPNQTALSAIDGELTFDELNRAANRIAWALLQRNVHPEDRVAFMLPRTSRVFSAMLGIMKAGCAFIPVDPESPADRVRHLLEDSQARFVLTQGESAYDNALDIDDLLRFDNTDNPVLDISPERLAYIIYTSGSTGKPKGVMLTHANAINYVENTPRNFHVHTFVRTRCKLVSIITVSFDAFLEDAFCTLMNGLPLVFASEEQAQNPDKLAALFERAKGTGANFTPSRLLQYLEQPEMVKALSRCRVITAGGEKYPMVLYKQLRHIAPGAVLINAYGPTETTISSNIANLNEHGITVGPPLHNVVERIVDIDGHALPIGVVGELWIGGEGVARGYYGQPIMTKQQFVTVEGIRYYRSGDLAKWTEEGNVIILGRNDGQIKLRGMRIELGEIENALMAIPGIRSCAVIVRIIAGREHISAFYTASRSWEPDQLRSVLSTSLARYMVPTAYRQLEELPETPNGKVDFKALPEALLTARRAFKPPKNDVERLFCKIFSQVLQLENISADDNFFDLGGTSLLVTRVVIEAHAHNLHLSFGDVFVQSTPEDLAKFLINNKGSVVARIENRPENYDYSLIHSLLAENNLESFNADVKRDLGNIVLTGATGFLGVHILYEFLRSEKGVVHCLVRGGKVSAKDRLKNLLFYYFGVSFEAEFDSRIYVVEGDITDTNAVSRLMEYRVDTFINCAANVKHFAAGMEIENVNLGGVKNSIDFCKKNNCRFIQISTVSVAGFSIDNQPPENTRLSEQLLYFGQNLDNKYLHSKFMSERLTLEAAVTAGLDVKIMRVGNLMPRLGDGEFQINFHTNSFIGMLKAYQKIGKIPFETMGHVTELSPVDSTAKAILSLARTPSMCRVFHPVNNHCIFIGDIINVLNLHSGLITPCEVNEFECAYQQNLQNPKKSKDISSLIAYRSTPGSRPLTLLESRSDYTNQILHRMNFFWPLTGEDYLERFISALSDLHFFD